MNHNTAKILNDEKDFGILLSAMGEILGRADIYRDITPGLNSLQRMAYKFFLDYMKYGNEQYDPETGIIYKEDPTHNIKYYPNGDTVLLSPHDFKEKWFTLPPWEPSKKTAPAPAEQTEKKSTDKKDRILHRCKNMAIRHSYSRSLKFNFLFLQVKHLLYPEQDIPENKHKVPPLYLSLPVLDTIHKEYTEEIRDVWHREDNILAERYGDCLFVKLHKQSRFLLSEAQGQKNLPFVQVIEPYEKSFHLFLDSLCTPQEKPESMSVGGIWYLPDDVNINKLAYKSLRTVLRYQPVVQFDKFERPKLDTVYIQEQLNALPESMKDVLRAKRCIP